MIKTMPRFDLKLADHAKSEMGLIRAGETARLLGNAAVKKAWPLARLESLYEHTFLRIFAAWEQCLEDVFFHSLCGFESRKGPEITVSGKYFHTIAKARKAVLGKDTYMLWYKPSKVLSRFRKFIKSAGPQCPKCLGLQEIVILSNEARLIYMANIRHRIAHDQRDARKKFNAATMAIAGRHFPKSCAGRFLRERDASHLPPRPWLETLSSELVGLTGQMV